MKKILFLPVVAILSVLSATAQLQGDGSLAHPWSGFLAGNLTVSGTKYFNGNIYVDNELLIISSGAKLVALQYRASIFVQGTGRVIAIGTAFNPITFTCACFARRFTNHQ